MVHSRLVIAAALAAALAAPLAACAQSQGTPASSTPSQSTAHQHGGMMRAVRELDLSDSQRTQIQQLVQQYRQQYPKGSTPDPQARKALRDKIFATLTPDQQAQLQQHLAQMRAERAQQSAGTNAPPASAPAPSPNSP